jgi:translocation and assembly module TamA
MRHPRGVAAAARLATAALPLLLLAGCGDDGAPADPFADEDAAFPRLPPIPYGTRFAGELPPDLAGLLPQVAQAGAGSGQPATSRLAIRQRAESNVARLQETLRAQGYFDARVGFRLEDPQEVPVEGIGEEIERLAERPKVILMYDVQPGPRYRFGALRVELADNPDGFPAPAPASLGLVAGEPALTQAVLDAEQKLLADARKAGFALARPGEREVIVDHEARAMDVTLRLEPGRRAEFGQVTFSGAEGIDIGFLRARVPYAEGQRYDPALLDEAQRDLFDTNLFSTIIVTPAGQLAAGERLPVAYELSQRPPRSIGAELNFQTDLGFGGRVFWEHRNVFGAGERFRVEAASSLPQQSATVTFAKPDVLRVRQNLLADIAFRRDNLDAYEATSLGTGVSLEREFSRQLRASLGVAYRYARIQDRDEPEETFGLLSLPAAVNWDFANDRFNPTRGGTVVATAAPYTDLLDTSRNFLKGRVTHTRYFELARSPQLVLALRGSLGALGGVSRDEVPADERFYAGGGGSIRGIGFQLAGPLDEDDEPIGGRSLIEGSIELRTKFTDSLGAVLFLDAGTVEDSVFPTGGEDILFGAGPGLRYYTPIGPVRVDLGFPLNPRRGVDDGFQLYLSIGQAF